MARKRLTAAERRRQILDVATPLFTEAGRDSVSTTEIARAAGITQPVLYQHFSSKEDLYGAAVLEPLRHYMHDLVVGIRSAADVPNRASRLSRVEKHWLNALVEAGPFIGAVLFGKHDAASMQYQTVIEPGLREICALLREFVLPAETSEETAWRYTRAIFGMNLLIMFDAAQRDEPPDANALARDLNLLLEEGQSGL